MDKQILRFLDALDADLAVQAEAGMRLDLYHIGRSALILHYGVNLSISIRLERGERQ